MSLTEIKSELSRLTPVELAEVEAHLRLIRWKNTPGLAERLSVAHARMDAGQVVTSEQLMERLGVERPDLVVE